MMATAYPKKIILIEPNSEFRSIFKLLISNSDRYVLLGDFQSFESAVDSFTQTVPDIILMGIDLKGINGIEATKIVKKVHPRMLIIILTTYETHDLVFECLHAGASGFISSHNKYAELIESLNAIQRDEAPMSGRVAKIIIDHFHINPDSPLTRREAEILKMVSGGKTYPEISEKLFISRETVKTHIRNTYSKLQVSTRSEAINKALSARFI